MISLAKFISIGQFIAVSFWALMFWLGDKVKLSGMECAAAVSISAIVMFLIWLLADIAESQRKGLEDGKTDV